MKKKQVAGMGALFLVWASTASASEPCVSYSEDWLKCETDNDCTVEETACYGRGAYNNQSLSLVRQHNKCIRPMIKCAPPPAGDADKNTAVCREHKCVAVAGEGATFDHERVQKLEKRIRELEKQSTAPPAK